MVNFEVTSGALRVTDPCYVLGTWCAGTLENVANGIWCADVEQAAHPCWGTRISKLFVWHEGVVGAIGFLSSGSAVNSGIDVGVDSGQAGFFDLSAYPTGKDLGKYGDEDSFYGKCCRTTLGEDDGDHWGTVNGSGVVSSSGLGDGSYICKVVKDTITGKVVAAMIDFGLDDWEEEDED